MRVTSLAALAALSVPAWSQPAPAPASALPPPAYQSALEGYRPFQDAEVAPWKESNDTVGRIGGWRAYAREAAQGASAARAAAPASTTGADAAPPASAPEPGARGHQH